MYTFLSNNYADLIARCKAKVSQRSSRAATAEQLTHGLPLFLNQLIGTLEAEEKGRADESLRISGPSGGGNGANVSVMGASATAHGRELLQLGYSVDQVVHDYRDMCQAITDLAVERGVPFSVDQFRTLNRCLDNAIADAVTEFSAQRDATISLKQSADENERRGILAHELRNHLHTATLAYQALETGSVAVGGSTGNLLKRSLVSMTGLVSDSLAEVRASAHAIEEDDPAFSLAGFIADGAGAASLDAASRGCRLTITAVDPLLVIGGDRDRLLAALVNLLQNALKFTRSHTEVTLSAYAVGERIHIDVSDNCGGLPKGSAKYLFSPFAQRSDDRRGLGLGLSIARESVEADAGVLSVKDLPGKGCVFTISLPGRSPAGAPL
jgi:signal transduction histidine kinase